MAVLRIDHVNIRTDRFDESVAFYRDVLGLDARRSPGADMTRSAWMYDSGGNPVIHVGRSDLGYPADRTLGLSDHGGTGTGKVDHVAFECSDLPAFQARVEAGGHAYQMNEVGSIGLTQLFVRDPNGVLFELNFR